MYDAAVAVVVVVLYNDTADSDNVMLMVEWMGMDTTLVVVFAVILLYIQTVVMLGQVTVHVVAAAAVVD